MPSFDVISQVDKHELGNALDQANRELGNRFDFKGVDASFTLDEYVITAAAPSEFQLKQMQDILRVTEQTTAGTQKTASAVGELANLATELKGSVAGFKVS